jgi:3-methylcrotonyl-CoA carboxylase beta subunit
MWPNARIAVMGGEQAAGVLVTVQQQAREKAGKAPLTEDEIFGIKSPILSQFQTQSDPYYSSARLWDDGIIEPAATRDVIGLALEVCYSPHREGSAYGIFRM